MVDYSELTHIFIPITYKFYDDPEYFWKKSQIIREQYKGYENEILIVISYKYFKSTITEKQYQHYIESLKIFPNIIVIDSKGVDWNGYKEKIEKMGINIFEDNDF